MPDPLQLLKAIAARADAVYLWTHFIDVEQFPVGDQRRRDWNAMLETRRFRGVDIRLYRLGYARANENVDFSGGMFDEHWWMDRNDLLAALGALEMTDITIGGESYTENPHGPVISLFARRP